MGGIIFISYRRGDGAGSAGRLYDRLEQIFSRQQLFFDVDTIAPGQDFVQDLQDKVDGCDVLLAVIGRSWIDARDERGQRRLDNPDDFVRIEVARALAAGKRVIPVLVDGADLPSAELLPEDLAGLAAREPVALQHDSFKADCDGLATIVRSALADIAAALGAAEEEAERKRRADEEQRRRQAKERWEALMGKGIEATPLPQTVVPQRRRPSRRGLIVGAAVLAAGGAAAAATRSFWYPAKAAKRISDAIVMPSDGSSLRVADIHSAGQVLATGDFSGVVRTWSLADGAPISKTEAHAKPVWRLSFSPQPGAIRLLTSAEDHTARAWNGAELSRSTVFSGDSGVRAAAWSPDGSRVVTGGALDGTIWDADSGKAVLTLSGHTSEIMSAAYSRNGQHIVTTSADTQGIVWYAETGVSVTILVGHDYWVGSGEFASNSQQIVTAGFDKTARTWAIGLMTELHVFEHGAVVTAARFSPDTERVLTASVDHTACLWEILGSRIATLSGHEAPVLDARFSPDGLLVVTAAEDQTARLWDGRTGDPLAVFVGHTKGVQGAMFAPDGRRVLTWSEDGSARLWPVPGPSDLT